MYSRESTDLVKKIIESNRCFVKATSDEAKKDILCIGTSFSYYSDADLISYGVNPEHCKRINNGGNNIIVVYSRKPTNEDNYTPPLKGKASTKSSLSLFDTQTKSIDVQEPSVDKESKNKKNENKSTISIFPFHENYFASKTFLSWGRFLHETRKKRQKFNSELYDERDSTPYSYENFVDQSKLLFINFESGIERALRKGNISGVTYNLQQAIQPSNLEEFVADDQIKLIKFINKLHIDLGEEHNSILKSKYDKIKQASSLSSSFK